MESNVNNLTMANFLLPIKFVQVFTGVNFNGGASVSTTFASAFSGTDSFEVFFAPGTGNGGHVDPYISYTKDSTTQITFRTTDGAVSSDLIDGAAVGY